MHTFLILLYRVILQLGQIETRAHLHCRRFDGVGIGTGGWQMSFFTGSRSIRDTRRMAARPKYCTCTDCKIRTEDFLFWRSPDGIGRCYCWYGIFFSSSVSAFLFPSSFRTIWFPFFVPFFGTRYSVKSLDGEDETDLSLLLSLVVQVYLPFAQATLPQCTGC
jgi:hypothetical protein